MRVDPIEQIAKIGILPILVLNKSENAVPAVRALKKGGLPVAEVTLRTAAALEAIQNIAREEPEVLVGAGTVRTLEQAQAAVKAGAQFLVMPGLQQEVVKWALSNGVTVIPGCATATELNIAMEWGLRALKFFPAESAGGSASVKAFASPYPEIRFIPTGGINESNLTSYLALNNVIACGGSWMIPQEDIDGSAFAKIEDATRRAVSAMLGFSLQHVGINTVDSAEAKCIAEQMGTLFSIPCNELAGAYFVGNVAEVVKGTYRGEKGHIGIYTNQIERAIYQLEKKGVRFDETTKAFNENGLLAIYLEQEIGGFAFHLRQRT